MGAALEARAYFLFGGKKKVAKEKATPGSEPRVAGYPAPARCALRHMTAGSEPRVAGYPAQLGGLGGSLNSPPLGGSDNASRLPPSPLRCSAPLKGPRSGRLKGRTTSSSFPTLRLPKHARQGARHPRISRNAPPSHPRARQPCGPQARRRIQHRRMASKNSLLPLVDLTLSRRNSIASRSSMGYRSLRRTHIFCSTSGLRSSSSRRVPERLTLMAG